jgi:hypothetical protein
MNQFFQLKKPCQIFSDKVFLFKATFSEYNAYLSKYSHANTLK